MCECVINYTQVVLRQRDFVLNNVHTTVHGVQCSYVYDIIFVLNQDNPKMLKTLCQSLIV